MLSGEQGTPKHLKMEKLWHNPGNTDVLSPFCAAEHDDYRGENHSSEWCFCSGNNLPHEPCQSHPLCVSKRCLGFLWVHCRRVRNNSLCSGTLLCGWVLLCWENLQGLQLCPWSSLPSWEPCAREIPALCFSPTLINVPLDPTSLAFTWLNTSENKPLGTAGSGIRIPDSSLPSWAIPCSNNSIFLLLEHVSLHPR